MPIDSYSNLHRRRGAADAATALVQAEAAAAHQGAAHRHRDDARRDARRRRDRRAVLGAGAAVDGAWLQEHRPAVSGFREGRARLLQDHRHLPDPARRRHPQGRLQGQSVGRKIALRTPSRPSRDKAYELVSAPGREHAPHVHGAVDHAAFPGDAGAARRRLVSVRPETQLQAARYVPALSLRAGAVRNGVSSRRICSCRKRSTTEIGRREAHMVAMRVLAALLLCAVAPITAHAQSWQPTKPITIVIPFPPGPGLDLVARMVGDKVSHGGRPAGGLREPHRRQRLDRRRICCAAPRRTARP